MINLIEAAALAAVEHLLPVGYQSLGIRLDVRHFAATPVGLRVTATAEVTGIEGRTVTFRVEARDEREVIGNGTHQRVVVNVARFDDRVQRKVRGAELIASSRLAAVLRDPGVAFGEVAGPRRAERSSAPWRRTARPCSVGTPICL